MNTHDINKINAEESDFYTTSYTIEPSSMRNQTNTNIIILVKVTKKVVIHDFIDFSLHIIIVITADLHNTKIVTVLRRVQINTCYFKDTELYNVVIENQNINSDISKYLNQNVEIHLTSHIVHASVVRTSNSLFHLKAR